VLSPGIRDESSWRIAICRLIFYFCIFSSGCSDQKAKPQAPDSGGGPSWDRHFPEHQEQPSWSANGIIAYRDNGIISVDSGGGATIDTSLAGLWSLDLGTGEKRRLLPFGHWPAWSHDGSTLAFASGQVFLVDPTGGNLRQLTSGGSNYHPAWHSSDSSIAFDSNRDSPTGSNDLWSVNVQTGVTTRLCPPVAGERREPNWSPTGDYLAMLAYPDSTSGLFSLSLTCSSVRLSEHSSYLHDPNYSPDGSMIAFCSDSEEGVPNVWVMNSDGSNARRITSGGGEWPSWSPDGAKLVYTRLSGKSASQDRGVLWVVDLQSGVSTQLTTWHHQAP
jgi:Tol biopolymer transport system component